jgi:SSS family solute:Na+ symporter
LGKLLLPSGIKGLFFLGLLATIMSTADSFLFLSGQSISRDLWKNSGSVWVTRLGIGVSALVGIVLAISFPSVIHLWYGLGSCLIPALLLAVFGTYVSAFRLQQKALFGLMLVSFLTSLSWLVLNHLEIITIVQIEPFYPGLGVALIGLGLFRNAKPKT